MRKVHRGPLTSAGPDSPILEMEALLSMIALGGVSSLPISLCIFTSLHTSRPGLGSLLRIERLLPSRHSSLEVRRSYKKSFLILSSV